MLAGAGPAGIAVMRLRTAIWTGRPEAHLKELYVVPPRRGRGIGGALLEATMAAAGEGSPEGPAMLFYERELD